MWKVSQKFGQQYWSNKLQANESTSNSFPSTITAPPNLPTCSPGSAQGCRIGGRSRLKTAVTCDYKVHRQWQITHLHQLLQSWYRDRQKWREILSHRRSFNLTQKMLDSVTKTTITRVLQVDHQSWLGFTNTNIRVPHGLGSVAILTSFHIVTLSNMITVFFT